MISPHRILSITIQGYHIVRDRLKRFEVVAFALAKRHGSMGRSSEAESRIVELQKVAKPWSIRVYVQGHANTSNEGRFWKGNRLGSATTVRSTSIMTMGMAAPRWILKGLSGDLNNLNEIQQFKSFFFLNPLLTVGAEPWWVLFFHPSSLSQPSGFCD